MMFHISQVSMPKTYSAVQSPLRWATFITWVIHRDPVPIWRFIRENANVFYRGTKYDISPLDAAIFADLGLTTNVGDGSLAANFSDVPSTSEIPEPGTID